MAFGIVVIAALLGTGGLGDGGPVRAAEGDVGAAFAAGMAIVFAAIALDRISTREHGLTVARGRTASFKVVLASLRRRRPRARHDRHGSSPGECAPRDRGGRARASVRCGRLPVGVADRHRGLDQPAASEWVNDNLRNGVPIVGGTRIVQRLPRHPRARPRCATSCRAWRGGSWSRSWSPSAGRVVAGGSASAVRRMSWSASPHCQVWDLAMDTLSQVLVIVVSASSSPCRSGSPPVAPTASTACCARSSTPPRCCRRSSTSCRCMFLFNVGRVPGVIASVVYAIPPCIRLTSLGLRQVPIAPSGGGDLVRRHVPPGTVQGAAARWRSRSIMLGINQTILMVLAMVDRRRADRRRGTRPARPSSA